jgi:RHS repeat-associated protein
VGTSQEERFARLRHQDTETNLDPTLHRMFCSDQGRWLSPDPLAGCVVNPQGLDRYAYVANNPTSRIDPAGSYIYTIAPVAGIDPLEQAEVSTGDDSGVTGVVLPVGVGFGGGGAGAPSPPFCPGTTTCSYYATR